MVEVDVSRFEEATWERNAFLACGCLVCYEYFLQLDNEVEFFWKQRWSLAKVLFLWSRYYGMAFNTGNLVVYLQPNPSFEFCSKFFYWANAGASLQTITTHLILQLRLYAMYSSSRRIFHLFIFLTLGEALIMGCVFGIPNMLLIATNEPSPGNFICADADPPDGSHWIFYFWVTTLFTEGVLFLLALYKAWQHRKSANGSNIMQRLTKDSVLYFFLIFWTYGANVILWYHNRITLNELAPAFAFVIPNILTNRLLISVRANYYSKVTDVGTYLASLQFTSSRHDRSRSTQSQASRTRMIDISALEQAHDSLQAFHERTGV